MKVILETPEGGGSLEELMEVLERRVTSEGLEGYWKDRVYSRLLRLC